MGKKGRIGREKKREKRGEARRGERFEKGRVEM